MNALTIALVVLLISGFVLRFIPQYQTDVPFIVAVFIILLLLLLGKLTS